MMKRNPLLCLLITTSLAVAGGAWLQTARAGATYDGAWTVMIMTQRGTCDGVHRLNVDIRDGALVYSDGNLELHGRVTSDGAVQVRVAAGGQAANGTGRLTERSGGGTWHGAGTSGNCTGRWSAERV